MLKLGKNLSWDFEVVYSFRKNGVLNTCRYLKGFYTYKKINILFVLSQFRGTFGKDDGKIPKIIKNL